MRTMLMLLASAAVAASAHAAPGDGGVRSLAKAEKVLRAGVALEKAATGKRKKANLRRAQERFRAARRIARSSLPRANKTTRGGLDSVIRKAEAGQVRVLLVEARTYWAKGSVSSARKRVNAALKLSPTHPEALDFQRRIAQGIRNGGDDYEPGVTGRRAGRDGALGLNQRQRLRTRVPGRR